MPRDNRLIFAFFIVTIDAMGIGLLMPVLPSILEELTGKGVSETSTIAMFLTASYAGMQFLFGPLIGNLSDRFGRRPVLLISIAALGLDYILLAVAPTVALLFLGRIIAGIAGATQSTAFAVAADVSKPEDRAASMGFVFAGFGLGFVLGPALGGLLGWLGTTEPAFLGPQMQAFFGTLGTRAPMYLAAALSLGNFAFGYFIFRESLAPENRRSFSWGRANPFGALAAIRDVRGIYFLLAASFVFGLSHAVYPNVWSFFARAAVGWDELQIGLSLALVGIGFVVVQGLLVGMLSKRFGEARTALIGLGFNLLAFALLAFAREGWIIWLGVPISAMGVLVGPAISALLSRSVDKQRQGEIQGISTSLAAIAYFIAPFMMNGSFTLFTAEDAPVFWPGAPFALAAVLIVVTSFIMLIVMRNMAARQAEADGEPSPA